MINPFFRFFKEYRTTFEQYLYNPFIDRIKQYPGCEHVVLPKPAKPSNRFVDLIKSRISESDFKDTHLSLEDLSTILYWSSAELGRRRDGHGNSEEKMQRPHPSGGAKYPLEQYVCADKIDGLERGIYHYRPDKHLLEFITPMTSDEMFSFKRGYQYAFAQDTPAFIVMSFILERGMPKYGALAYKLGLIEAGHIGQNMYLLAAALDVKCSAMGGLDEDFTNDLLGLDGYNETTFYSIALGKTETGHSLSSNV